MLLSITRRPRYRLSDREPEQGRTDRRKDRYFALGDIGISGENQRNSLSVTGVGLERHRCSHLNDVGNIASGNEPRPIEFGKQFVGNVRVVRRNGIRQHG